MDSLLRLVGDLAALESAWEQTPLLSKGLGEFSDVFSVEIAQRMVDSGLPLGSVRLFRSGTPLPAEAIARARERGGREREPIVDGERVAACVTEGATLVIEEVQSHCPEVAAFAAKVARATGYGTYCAAFLTPPHSRGVAPHYDTASVFLRQVAGSKRWRISLPEHRWPVREWSSSSNVDTEEVLDIVLRPGDCLYLPRGFVHVGDATGEASVHLSIALRPTTWGSVLRRLTAPAYTEPEAMREALPPRFGKADVDELLRERLTLLSALLSDRLGAISAADLPLPPAAPLSRAEGLARALNLEGEPSHDDT